MAVYSDEQLRPVRDDIARYLANVHGIENPTGRHFRCLNPAHEERTPSMILYADSQRAYCYGCGASADVFQLAGWDNGTDDFREQAKLAAYAVGIDLGKPQTAKPIARKLGADKGKRPKPRPFDGPDVSPAVYAAAFDLFDPPAARALDYLHGRAFADDEIIGRFGFGWCRHPSDVMPGKLLSIRGADAGFVCIPFPDDSQWGSVRYCTFRPIDAPGLGKELKPDGLPAVIYREHLLRGDGVMDGRVYVTEGAFDAAALSLLLGGASVCAISGGGGQNRALDVLADTPKAKRPEIVLAFDQNDKAGEKYTEQMKGGLTALGIPWGVLPGLPGGVKDANEALIEARKGAE